jgi:hypothetical protein
MNAAEELLRLIESEGGRLSLLPSGDLEWHRVSPELLAQVPVLKPGIVAALQEREKPQPWNRLIPLADLLAAQEEFERERATARAKEFAEMTANRERSEQAAFVYQPRPPEQRESRASARSEKARILLEVYRDFPGCTVAELSEASGRTPRWVRKTLRAAGITMTEEQKQSMRARFQGAVYGPEPYRRPPAAPGSCEFVWTFRYHGGERWQLAGGEGEVVAEITADAARHVFRTMTISGSINANFDSLDDLYKRGDRDCGEFDSLSEAKWFCETQVTRWEWAKQPSPAWCGRKWLFATAAGAYAGASAQLELNLQDERRFECWVLRWGSGNVDVVYGEYRDYYIRGIKRAAERKFRFIVNYADQQDWNLWKSSLDSPETFDTLDQAQREFAVKEVEAVLDKPAQ